MMSFRLLQVECVSGKLEAMSEKYRLCKDRNRDLENKIEHLDRKLHDMEAENQELAVSVNKREDLVLQHNVSQSVALLSHTLQRAVIARIATR